jgi:probable HAF family extracellular repeat protein
MKHFLKSSARLFFVFSSTVLVLLLVAHTPSRGETQFPIISQVIIKTQTPPPYLINRSPMALRIFSPHLERSNRPDTVQHSQSLSAITQDSPQNGPTYEYQVRGIEPPVGYQRSRSLGINNSGMVVGRFYNYNADTEKEEDRQAFIWSKIKGASLLPSLNGDSSAWGVNDAGLVSGYSYNQEEYKRAVRWDSNDETIVDIGVLTPSQGTGGNESDGYDLNNLGQVVGLADILDYYVDGTFVIFHAFLYDDATGIQDLGTFTTAVPEYQNGYSIAYDINTHGQVVGIANNSSWAFLPFIYDETNGMQALTRDSNYLSGEWYAVVINDSGLIGGHVIATTNQSLPFYWPDSSVDPIQITMPSGFPYGEIYGINESGQMVGIMWDSDQDDALEHAFIFDTENGVRDLNDLLDPGSGWTLTFARDINNSAQIVGYGEVNGEHRGFILTPIASSVQAMPWIPLLLLDD